MPRACPPGEALGPVGASRNLRPVGPCCPRHIGHIGTLIPAARAILINLDPGAILHLIGGQPAGQIVAGVMESLPPGGQALKCRDRPIRNIPDRYRLRPR